MRPSSEIEPAAGYSAYVGREIAGALTSVPEGFKLHRTIQRFLDNRRKAPREAPPAAGAEVPAEPGPQALLPAVRTQPADASALEFEPAAQDTAADNSAQSSRSTLVSPGKGSWKVQDQCGREPRRAQGVTAVAHNLQRTGVRGEPPCTPPAPPTKF